MESLHTIKGLWNLSNIGAENSDTRIKLERDSLGRVVKEWQDAHWISSRYDEMGERIETTSSFGASILTRRNEMGQAAQVIAYMDKERPWEGDEPPSFRWCLQQLEIRCYGQTNFS